MTAAERLKNILASTQLGPVTPYFGIVGGKCECGKPSTKRHRPGKHPRLDGWQTENATTDHRQIRRWFRQYPDGNFAVVSGVDLVVLDLDVRNGKNGVAELEALAAAADEEVPRTVTVLSGSGSGARHLYFRKPPNLERLQKPTGTKGIDFLRSRQGALVPGSRHESGHFYQFSPGLSPDDVEFAEIPQWLLALMERPSAIRRSTTPAADGVDELFDEMIRMGPPPGSMPPGRRRPDDIVKRRMAKVTMRKYPDDRSHSDSHWAWTLAKYCSHHWDQYIRIWRESGIRNLPGTKCGRATYEASILEKAFLAQRQQWTNFKRRPIEASANPTLAKRLRKLTDHTESPKSPIAKAVVLIHNLQPDLDYNGIAQVLNASGVFERVVTTNYVKQIRSRYAHHWKQS